MTEMKRITVAIPEEIDEKSLELKKQDEFVRSSYSAIVRVLLMEALGFEKTMS